MITRKEEQKQFILRKAKAFGIFLFASFILWHCATQTSPTGGPQDKKPPKLIASSPENNSTNFKGKRIILTFDEEVDVKNPKEEITSNPPLGKKTKYTANRNKIYIDLEEPLLDSTTFSIFFKEAVVDKSEKNPAVNLRLAFSTGPIIDSLKIEGKVFSMKTNKPAENITVAIFEQDTFNIFKHSPMYFAKTIKDGKFIIPNLKQNYYFVYAFDDKNKNMKVESQSEAFDFTTEAMLLDTNKIAEPFYLFRLNANPPKVMSVRNSKSIAQVSFNKPLKPIHIEPADTSIYMPIGIGENGSDLVFYKEDMPEDSMAIRLRAYDSVYQKLDTAIYIKNSALKSMETSFKTVSSDHQIDLDTYLLTSKLKFNKPIKNIILDSCVVAFDTVYVRTLGKEHFEIDEISQEVTIKVSMAKAKEIFAEIEKKKKIKEEEEKKQQKSQQAKPKPPAPEKEKIDSMKTLVKSDTLKNDSLGLSKNDTTKLKAPAQKKPPREISNEITVAFGKGAFISAENDSSKREEKKIPLKSEEPGSLKVELYGKDPHTVLQLYNKNGLFKEVKNVKKYTFEKLPPEEYQLKLLVDKNNDGKWTPGNFHTKQAAEKILIYFSKEGSEKIPIRSNWEYGPVKFSY